MFDAIFSDRLMPSFQRPLVATTTARLLVVTTVGPLAEITITMVQLLVETTTTAGTLETTTMAGTLETTTKIPSSLSVSLSLLRNQKVKLTTLQPSIPRLLLKVLPTMARMCLPMVRKLFVRRVWRIYSLTGQVASKTSTNNFINFCLTVPDLPITNGQQITGGSCNPAPMGVLPSTDNMPSSKFVSPKNGDVLKENTPFTITMAIRGMETGFFVNAQENYFAAPQFLNANGQIQGHSHVVVELLDAIDQTQPTDPKKFAFFKGLNAPAANGQLTADVTNGLPAGVYKLSSINSAANHQPVLVPIAQHGSLDDAVYVSFLCTCIRSL